MLRSTLVVVLVALTVASVDGAQSVSVPVGSRDRGAVSTALASDVPPQPAPAPVYRPPVDAPVRDGFRPPVTPYGPGNRGLEYATVPGAVAGAIGAGVVTFAGWVAGRGVVTVLHADGLRSSLTGLATLLVVEGDRVTPGVPLGTTTTSLHLGVRRGEVYIDPSSLFAPPDARPRHAVLVPLPG